MKVRLLMQVSQDADGRLNGQIAREGERTPHDFSGTLELLSILEHLVVPDSRTDAGGEHGGPLGAACPTLPAAAGTPDPGGHSPGETE